jgi:hypothetical protein
LKDGLQGVPFDRWLMRVKDIIQIITSLITMFTMIFGGLWLAFKFIQTQNQIQEVLLANVERVGR